MTISDPTAPDTIVLIHGFWVTPRSWRSGSLLPSQGLPGLAPAYPGFEVEVEALNTDPTPIEHLTVPAILEHLDEVLGGAREPPIMMGHSAGGVFTQLLLDRGYGAVGVVMTRPPPRESRSPLSPAPVDVSGAPGPGPQEGRRLHV